MLNNHKLTFQTERSHFSTLRIELDIRDSENFISRYCVDFPFEWDRILSVAFKKLVKIGRVSVRAEIMLGAQDWLDYVPIAVVNKSFRVRKIASLSVAKTATRTLIQFSLTA